MIELRNIEKIYKAKKSSSTMALRGVNLTLPNKGLIFIVGKSGSGKSTLLNLLGGLDSPTSGEIIVSGKNIENFSSEELDSYRNSYVGFVFQEFNVLEQYDVYENICLALKLQEEQVSKEKIDILLEKLGIKDLGSRRINELSGGQKQRVAIARALIKEPKIILADEPTGNLDSTSSSQIFDILKDISKNQLVVVVSHDKESALKYSDRIIEIEDGSIVKDTASIEVLDEEELTLKKSKLPFGYALKMATTSFKRKPIKFIMTVILTAMALVFMSFFVNIALFNKERLITNTMKDNSNYIYDVGYAKFYGMTNGNANMISYMLNDNDINKLTKLVDNKLNVVYNLYDNGKQLVFEFGQSQEPNALYDMAPYVGQFVEVKDDRIFNNIIGKAPSSENEIVVHKCFADFAIKCGIRLSDDSLYFPKSYEELVTSRKGIKLGNNSVYITGIINDDDSIYLESKKEGRFTSDRLGTYYYDNYHYLARTVYGKGLVNYLSVNNSKETITELMTITNIKRSHMLSSMDISLLNTKTKVITSGGVEEISELDKGNVILSVTDYKAFDKKYEEGLSKYLLTKEEGDYNTAVVEFTSSYLMENAHNLELYLLVSEIDPYLNEEGELILNLAGVSLDEENYLSYDYTSDYKIEDKYLVSAKVYDDDVAHLRKVFKNMVFSSYLLETPEGTYYYYGVSDGDSIAGVISFYKFAFRYILAITIVFVLFAFLLFSNSIATSISYCKKEIGILRALGASKKDIIKIFGYEAIIIGICSWILSIIGWFISCNLLNNSLFGNYFFKFNAIVANPVLPVITFIFTIALAVFITITSISRITKIKPIDAILNK